MGRASYTPDLSIYLTSKGVRMDAKNESMYRVFWAQNGSPEARCLLCRNRRQRGSLLCLRHAMDPEGVRKSKAEAAAGFAAAVDARRAILNPARIIELLAEGWL